MLTRRTFLAALGIGAAAVAIEEPVRRMWFVPSSAPVGSRVERLTRDPLDGPWPRVYAGRWEAGHGWQMDGVQAAVKSRYDAWARIGSRDTTFNPDAPGLYFQDSPSPDAYQIRGWDPGHGESVSMVSEVDVKNGRLTVRKVTAADLEAQAEAQRLIDDVARQLQTFGRKVIAIAEEPADELAAYVDDAAKRLYPNGVLWTKLG
jgi:hypothetical protein